MPAKIRWERKLDPLGSGSKTCSGTCGAVEFEAYVRVDDDRPPGVPHPWKVDVDVEGVRMKLSGQAGGKTAALRALRRYLRSLNKGSQGAS